MHPVFAIASNIISPLGLNTSANWQAISAGISAIKEYSDNTYSNTPYWASMINPGQWQYIQQQTKDTNLLPGFERLAFFSASEALRTCEQDIDLRDTIFILSTTKGNIEYLGKEPDKRLLLQQSAKLISSALGIKHKSITVSHACISGVVALIYASRLLQSGRYKNAIVTGCDRFSHFVLSGFQSFQALANEPCKPFDVARKGLNLGEGASTIILSTTYDGGAMKLTGTGISNDANHISGPSRTGVELAMAIRSALKEADINAASIGMISAHGTATIYNDEMESKAFAVAGMSGTPVHSLKGYVGHTLGAAGIIESALTLEAMKHQCLIPSAGFSEAGVPEPINVTTQMEQANLQYALKTASGFGGCNAAVVWKYVAE